MSSRPGILHILTDLRLGGAQQMLLARIRGCPGFRHAVLIFETHTGARDQAGPDLADEIRDAGAALHTLGVRTPGEALRLWLSGGLEARLRDLIHHQRPDLIHSTLYHGHLLGALAASRSLLPHLAGKEGLDSWMGPISRRLEAWALRRASGVAAVSEAAAAEVRSLGVPAGRIRVIHNGIDLAGTAAREDADEVGSQKPKEGPGDLPPRVEPAHGGTEGPITLIGIGRLAEAKGWADLIESFARAKEHEPSAQLEIYGHGSLEPRLRQLSARLGLDPSRTLPGPGPGVDRILRLHPRPVLVLPSREEGFGLVLLEAMARGVPILATTAGGIPEVVRDGAEALLVPPRNPDALCGAVLRLARDPGLRRRLGEAGLRRVREFDLQRMLDAYQEYVVELLKQGTAPRTTPFRVG